MLSPRLSEAIGKREIFKERNWRSNEGYGVTPIGGGFFLGGVLPRLGRLPFSQSRARVPAAGLWPSGRRNRKGAVAWIKR